MKRAGPKRKQPRRAAPRATKAQRLGESPVTLRLPVDLVARVDALLPAVARDNDTATLLGGVSHLRRRSRIRSLAGRSTFPPVARPSVARARGAHRMRAQRPALRSRGNRPSLGATPSVRTP